MQVQGQSAQWPASRLPHWELAGLEPLGGVRHLTACCLSPTHLQQQAAAFMQASFSSLLETAPQDSSCLTGCELPAKSSCGWHLLQDVGAAYAAHRLGSHLAMLDCPANGGLYTYDARQGRRPSSSRHSWMPQYRAACEQLQRRLLLDPPDLRRALWRLTLLACAGSSVSEDEACRWARGPPTPQKGAGLVVYLVIPEQTASSAQAALLEACCALAPCLPSWQVRGCCDDLQHTCARSLSSTSSRISSVCGCTALC